MGKFGFLVVQVTLVVDFLEGLVLSVDMDEVEKNVWET